MAFTKKVLLIGLVVALACLVSADRDDLWDDFWSDEIFDEAVAQPQEENVEAQEAVAEDMEKRQYGGGYGDTSVKRPLVDPNVRPGYNGGGIRRPVTTRPGYNGGGVKQPIVRPGQGGGGVKQPIRNPDVRPGYNGGGIRRPTNGGGIKGGGGY